MTTPGFDVLQNIDIEITRITLKNKIGWILRMIEYSHTPSIPEVATKQTIKQPVQETIATKKSHSILDSLVFLIKYLTTTAAIFAVLMLTTNYQAYYQIAKSYVYADQIAASEQGLINSVQAASWEDLELQAAPQELRKQRYETLDDATVARWTSYSIKTLTDKTLKDSSRLDIEITPYENRIIIPKIGKNIPLVEVTEPLIGNEKELNDIFMKDLENWVVRYPSSVKPGENGNSFIFGHSSNFPWIKWNYNEVFALMDKLSYWDEIIVYYDQQKYVYVIREKQVIDPKNVGVIKKSALKPRLTLMTCWPIGTTLNRLIVVAELVEQSDI